MLDTLRTDAPDAPARLEGQTFDLVVIGAGIAGLNALYAASDYLEKGARVLLLDQKQAPGGMWTVAYDYVRLHQPHPMFTVGDMKWDWSKPREYLAARDEVQRHLARCLDPIEAKLRLAREFGQTVAACREELTSSGPRARVTFHANDDQTRTVEVTATQVIEAGGYNVPSPEPLGLSSSSVVSIAPTALRATLAAHPDAPVYVIGGGKTAMDTVIEVLNAGGAREIGMLVGKGTDFFNRNQNLPTGFQRWTTGRPTSRIFHEMARVFNGDNEDEVHAHFQATIATDRESKNQQFLFGLLSEEELARVEAGVSMRRYDYLEDIADTPDGPKMRLRGGETLRVPEGSLIVNCTGNLFRTSEAPEARPCLSTHGTILSINLRDSLHFLTSVAGFFLPHLHYRGLLKDQGFYSIDMEGLFRRDRVAWVAATNTQAYLTHALAVRTLPLSLLDRCGLDFDRWFPLPRRMFALLKMKTGAAKDIPHCQRVLDRVGARFGVHVGPLIPKDRNG